MKLTRERKIFGAVLVIALGFLSYDQINGAAATDAAHEDSGALLLASNSRASGTSGNLTTDTSTDISLATRLSVLASKSGASATADRMRDAFRPAEGWLSKPVVAIAAPPTISSADRFVLEHKLTAISMNASGGGAVAVVDGKLLHIGGAIDGYRLTRVDGQRATFESSDGGRATLTLAANAASSSAAAR
jgi:hypothetical protein